MGKTLYLECYSGISGDMTAAALLDLGADRDVLKRALDSLPVQGFQTKISRVKKSGLDVCDFAVLLDAEHENHDHDMEYLYGHEHGEHSHEGEHGHGGHDGHDGHDGHEHGEHSHEGEHGHGGHDGHEHGEHSHGVEHEHGGHGHGDAPVGMEHSHEAAPHYHSHAHRGLPEILHIISHAEMTPRAKELAERIFGILADAEAKAHGVPREQVHFHEVGAVDSIVDILTVAVCLDDLDIDECIVSPLCEGTGTVRCQHGILPVPVPAVANIAAEHGLRLHFTGCPGELVTPTGAAIAAAIRTGETLPEPMVIQKIGMGAGKRETGLAGFVRAMLVEQGTLADAPGADK